MSVRCLPRPDRPSAFTSAFTAAAQGSDDDGATPAFGSGQARLEAGVTFVGLTSPTSLFAERYVSHFTLTQSQCLPASSKSRYTLPVAKFLTSLVTCSAGRQKIGNISQVTVMLSKPDRGVEAIIRKAERASNGAWRVDKLVLPMAGNWSVRVDVLVTDFQRLSLRTKLPCGHDPSILRGSQATVADHTRA